MVDSTGGAVVRQASQDRKSGSPTTVTEFKPGTLPPLLYADLPETPRLRKVIGPGVILLAGAMGAGEFIIWPYMASQVGFTFLWAAILGLGTQYLINMEVARYTLATGETAVTGFTRIWRPWWWLFVLMALLQVGWPGWAAGAATILTFALGFGNVTYIAAGSLILAALLLTLSPVVYQFMEKFGIIKVTLMIGLLITAVATATKLSDWQALAIDGPRNIGTIPEVPGIGFAALFAAVALAGSGGFANLAFSNFLRDKGLGMGAYIPKLVSPVTGVEESIPALGYLFPRNEANMARWRKLWRVVGQEQFITFFAMGVIGIVTMSVLAYSTTYGKDVGQQFDFILAEGQVLQEIVGPWFGTFFWSIGAALLFYTTVANFDCVGRLTADAVKVNVLQGSSFWSESKIYAGVVWGLALVGVTLLLAGFSQPLTLLIVSAVVTGVIMFIYSGLFIVLNYFRLPEGIRMSRPRVAGMVWSVLFFGSFSAVTILDRLGFVTFG